VRKQDVGIFSKLLSHREKVKKRRARGAEEKGEELLQVTVKGQKGIVRGKFYRRKNRLEDERKNVR